LPQSVTMVHMSSAVKWWSRLTAAMTGAILTLVVPVHAWAASNGVADVAVEAVRYRRRRGGLGFGLIGALCCLAVVAVIVLVIYLISRNRKRR
jgi:ABC-type multidrug transport system permease subunit